MLRIKKIVIIAIAMLFFTRVSAQLSPGQQAPEIILPNAKDSLIRLSSFQGKVVLIDFWASWCGPCRASNPAVVRLYNKYKSEGFHVFAISIDTRKQNWLNAVKQDRLSYLQVNDSQGWRSRVAETYKVEQIPTTFLLDKKGKIIAVDAEGPALEKLVKRELARQ